MQSKGLQGMLPRSAVLSSLEFKPAVDVYAKFPEQKLIKPALEPFPTLATPEEIKLSLTGAAPNG
jgi:hypothetical protein